MDYARRIFDRFDDKTVLSIGAGKMSTLVLQNFFRPAAQIIAGVQPRSGQSRNPGAKI